MGDGNFHMQLRAHAKPLSKDPSYFGDAGFFAEQKLYRNYTEAASKSNLFDKKVICMAIFSSHSTLTFSLYRKLNALLRREHLPEIALL